jgi:photosystem II stability/assembly factor-like uncharacterized protein
MASGTTSRLRGLHGNAVDNLVAVGRNGVVLRFDGVSWTSSIEGPGFDLYDVWMFDSGDAYAVGAGGVILRSQGAGWVDASLVSVTDSLLAVWGTSPDNVYVVGGQSRALKWNGLQWKLVTIDVARVNNYHAVFGTADNDVYVGAEFMYAGSVTTASELPLHAGGLIYHWDGSAWEIPYQDPIHDILSIWVASQERAFATGDAASVLVAQGGQWLRVQTVSYLPFYVRSVWGTSPSDVLIVGDNGAIARYSP